MTKDLNKRLGAGLFILAFSLLYSTTSSAQTCVNSNRCDELGYNKKVSDCEGIETLVCPFDNNKVFCTKQTNDLVCNIGNIYYSDKSCSVNIESGKTAIGIVFDTTNKLIVALDEQQKFWTNSSSYWDVDSLQNIQNNPDIALTDMDGKGNTSKIMAYKNANSGTVFEAAEYCASYKTNGTSLGQWFLPSLGQLQQLYNAKYDVNASLSVLGKGLLTNNYWSSSENSDDGAWGLLFSEDRLTVYIKHRYHGYVRPVMQF